MGVIKVPATQGLVRIDGARVLVEPNPLKKAVAACPMAPPSKPCLVTVTVDGDKSYSKLVKINGDRVCLDTVTGFTDGAPPGSVKYSIASVGQKFVMEG